MIWMMTYDGVDINRIKKKKTNNAYWMCLLYHESTQGELLKYSEEPCSTNSRKLKGI